MGQSWDRKAAGAVSDAIPNEFSKLNGFSKYLQYIPYVGWAAKAVFNGVSGVDRFGETYSNGGSLSDSLQWGMSAANDTSTDPYKYSPKNDSWDNADGWLKAGKIGEALPGSKTDVGSVGRTGNLVGGIINNTNTHQSEHGPGSPGYDSSITSGWGNMLGGSSGGGAGLNLSSILGGQGQSGGGMGGGMMPQMQMPSMNMQMPSLSMGGGGVGDTLSGLFQNFGGR